MHIIKISPVSFKIVLSKQDLKRHGVENILHHTDISGDFFEEIMNETNRLYGNPFTYGSIDAEFFESKNGGGELFLCKSKSTCGVITYLFKTSDSDVLFSLCKRLSGFDFCYDSKLFLEKDVYSLLLLCRERNDFLLSVIKEYGKVSEISRLQVWLLEEHSALLIDSHAAERICEGSV